METGRGTGEGARFGSSTFDRLDGLRPELMKYCLKITGCRWDADDLAQDTAIRVMRSLESKPDRPLSKAFLFRIATNLWIDQKRKKRVASEPLDAEHERHAAPESAFETRELLELLADRLAPKHMFILLLMDVFDFTAKETARMLSTSEGAVQITLSRARAKLKALSSDRQGKRDGGREKRQANRASLAGFAFETLVEAFRERDPQAIYNAYVRLSDNGARTRTGKTTAGRLYFTFRDPDGNVLMVSS